jgi:hypothetical protein
MRTGDERPMTAELAARTESYVKWKHRRREVVVDPADGKRRWVMKTPPKVQPGDLLFSAYRWPDYKGPRATPTIIYFEYTQAKKSD